MSFSSSEAYLVHARHCNEDSKNEEISAQNRVSLAMNAGELIFKALYYKHEPNGKVEGHLGPRLSGKICHQLDITPPKQVVESLRSVEKHYKASRYPEETTKYFCELSMQVGCHIYPEILESVLEDIETIFMWVEEEIKR